MAQSITISIDDVADVNIIPDLLIALNYTGANNATAKANFIKAWLIQQVKDKVLYARMNTAIATVNSNNSNIPIT